MDEKIEKAIKPLLEMYEEIENDLLVMIASHFKINEEFLNSDYWRIQKMEEMGVFNREVIEYLAKYTGKTEEEIMRALNEIGIETINLDRLNQIFEAGRLRINPSILVNNYTIQNIIEHAYNELNNEFINLSQNIERATRRAYLDIVESAYLKTTMGTHSYQESIREAINDLSNKGIRTVTYQTLDENGVVIGLRTYDIESIVRRDVLTNTRKLSNEINQEVANELECEYIYISEHLECRPTHFDWQGTIIKREDLESITHYGAVDGLGGINCKHYFEPYFGDSRGGELKQYGKNECTQAYNLSQYQRYLERGIRKWKRKAEMFKANGDSEAFNKSNTKVKEWQTRLSNFTKENNRRRDYTREYVTQNRTIFNDNIVENDFNNLDNSVEHLIIYDINSNERLLQITNNSKNGVGNGEAMKLLRKAQKNTLVATHNHPSGSSFSLTDIKTFNHYDSINLIVVNTDEYLYYLEKNGINKIKEKDLIKNYTSMKNKYFDIYGKNRETLHKLNLDFSREVGWNYGRKNKRR